MFVKDIISDSSVVSGILGGILYGMISSFNIFVEESCSVCSDHAECNDTCTANQGAG